MGRGARGRPRHAEVDVAKVLVKKRDRGFAVFHDGYLKVHGRGGEVEFVRRGENEGVLGRGDFDDVLCDGVPREVCQGNGQAMKEGRI